MSPSPLGAREGWDTALLRLTLPRATSCRSLPSNLVTGEDLRRQRGGLVLGAGLSLYRAHTFLFRDELGAAVGQGLVGGGLTSRLVGPTNQVAAVWSLHCDKQHPCASGPSGPESARPSQAHARPGGSPPAPGSPPRPLVLGSREHRPHGTAPPGRAEQEAVCTQRVGGTSGTPLLWVSRSPPRNRPHEGEDIPGAQVGETQCPRNKLLTGGIWFQFPFIFFLFLFQGTPGDQEMLRICK